MDHGESLRMQAGPLEPIKQFCVRDYLDGNLTKGVSMIVVTDTHWQEPNDIIDGMERLAQLARNEKNPDARAVLHTGDMLEMYDHGLLATFEVELERHFSDMPFMLSIGNHDLYHLVRRSRDVRDALNFVLDKHPPNKDALIAAPSHPAFREYRVGQTSVLTYSPLPRTFNLASSTYRPEHMWMVRDFRVRARQNGVIAVHYDPFESSKVLEFRNGARFVADSCGVARVYFGHTHVATSIGAVVTVFRHARPSNEGTIHVLSHDPEDVYG